MEHQFWHQRWESGQIAFHEGVPNQLLVRHFDALGLIPGQRIFVPLCGKSCDLGWLLAEGYQVVAIELNPLAVGQLFDSLQLAPTKQRKGDLEQWQAGNLTVFIGDIFSLTTQLLGEVDAVYDRAALVALPDAMRLRYSQQLQKLAPQAKQLLICFEYDVQALSGPPFSIDAAEVERHYAKRYQCRQLERHTAELKGVAASEVAWLLTAS